MSVWTNGGADAQALNPANWSAGVPDATTVAIFDNTSPAVRIEVDGDWEIGGFDSTLALPSVGEVLKFNGHTVSCVNTSGQAGSFLTNMTGVTEGGGQAVRAQVPGSALVCDGDVDIARLLDDDGQVAANRLSLHMRVAGKKLRYNLGSVNKFRIIDSRFAGAQFEAQTATAGVDVNHNGLSMVLDTDLTYSDAVTTQGSQGLEMRVTANAADFVGPGNVLGFPTLEHEGNAPFGSAHYLRGGVYAVDIYDLTGANSSPILWVMQGDIVISTDAPWSMNGWLVCEKQNHLRFDGYTMTCTQARLGDGAAGIFELNDGKLICSDYCRPRSADIRLDGENAELQCLYFLGQSQGALLSGSDGGILRADGQATPTSGTIFYVSNTGGSNSNNGGQGDPWETVEHAIANATPGSGIAIARTVLDYPVAANIDTSALAWIGSYGINPTRPTIRCEDGVTVTMTDQDLYELNLAFGESIGGGTLPPAGYVPVAQAEFVRS